MCIFVCLGNLELMGSFKANLNGLIKCLSLAFMDFEVFLWLVTCRCSPGLSCLLVGFTCNAYMMKSFLHIL